MISLIIQLSLILIPRSASAACIGKTPLRGNFKVESSSLAKLRCEVRFGKRSKNSVESKIRLVELADGKGKTLRVAVEPTDHGKYAVGSFLAGAIQPTCCDTLYAVACTDKGEASNPSDLENTELVACKLNLDGIAQLK